VAECALEQVILQRHLVQPLQVQIWNEALLLNQKSGILQLLSRAQGRQNPDYRVRFLVLALFDAKNNRSTLREQEGCGAPAKQGETT
jgi:hypothetical protein